VKRFLLLLVLVAGGLVAASFSVPSNAAVVNGQSISQDQLNSDLTAIANSKCYQGYLTAVAQGQGGLPPIDGAGQPSGEAPHTTSTSSFAASYLDLMIQNEIVLQVAAQHHVAVTSQEINDASTGLKNQISQSLSSSGGSPGCTATTGDQVLATMPSSFVQSTERFGAVLATFERKLSSVGPSDADLKSFFDAHRPVFDNVCFTAAFYTSGNDAEAAKAAIYEGATFSSLAAKTNGGGPQGCIILYGLVAAVSSTTDLQTLPLNTVSVPIAISNGEYVLLEFTSRTPSSFTAARASVQQAALSIGTNRARTFIGSAIGHARVTVDPRYGAWNPTTAQLRLFAPPMPSDVLNPNANSPPSATGIPSGSSVSSGQSG
jgi:hypothetical protein